MLDRRAFLGGVASLAAVPWLAGCGRVAEVFEHDDDEQESGSWLRCCIDPPASIDPATLMDAAGAQVALQLFDPLMRYDPISHELTCLAASSYEVSADARTFTFHLKEGATFHAGDAVDAVSFKRAWERLFTAELAGDDAADEDSVVAPNAALLTHVSGWEACRDGSATELVGVTCPDAYTLQVVLDDAFAEFPALLCHPALSPVPSSAISDAATFALTPQGNGAFAFEAARKDGDAIRLVRNDAYAGDAPALDGVKFVTESDTVAAFKRYEAGDADLCAVPVEQLENVKKNMGESEDGYRATAGHRLLRGPRPQLQYLVCNMASAKLANLPLRRALSCAIDRDALAEKTLSGAYVAATGLLSPCLGAADAWSACTYDAEQAASLLEAGYPADESGARELTVALACSKHGVAPKIADAVVSDLSALGVKVTIELSERADLLQRLRTGDFELALTSWAPAAPSWDAAVAPIVASSYAGQTNVSGYTEASVDEALASAHAATDSSTRQSLIAGALATAGEALPVIPLAFSAPPVVVSEHVATLELGAFGAARLSEATLV